MMQRLTSRALLSTGKRLGQQLWDELSVCRECGRPANPLDWICDHCGTGNPVKVGVSPHVLLTAVACEIVLVLLILPLG